MYRTGTLNEGNIVATAEIVTDRVDIVRGIRVTFAEDERPAIEGDRKRGGRLGERRPARVISIRLEYVWSFDKQEWLGSWWRSGSIEQQKADGSWSDAQPRTSMDFEGLSELRKAHQPTSTIIFEEKDA